MVRNLAFSLRVSYPSKLTNKEYLGKPHETSHRLTSGRPHWRWAGAGRETAGPSGNGAQVLTKRLGDTRALGVPTVGEVLNRRNGLRIVRAHGSPSDRQIP